MTPPRARSEFDPEGSIPRVRSLEFEFPKSAHLRARV
jgi:hypothetical protein